MAIAFGIPYNVCQSRIAELKNTKRISGAYNEQGYFVYITDDERRTIKTLLEENGKISIDEVYAKLNISLIK